MQKKLTELKCDCGGQVVLIITPYHQDCRTECSNCGRHTTWCYEQDEAIKEWKERFEKIKT